MTARDIIATLVDRHRWASRIGYGQLTCPSCGAVATEDPDRRIEDPRRVRRIDTCSPSCPWRQAEEWLEANPE